jgi:hypothetical protein
VSSVGILLVILGVFLFVRTYWGHLPHLIQKKAFS